MQAGDSLNFIQSFSAIERQPEELETVSHEDVMVLAQILRVAVNEQAENVHSFDILEESGIVTIFESSMKLDMPDASYLHIVVHGAQNEGGLLDFGVSVIEHLHDGTYNGGYTYRYDADGITRSTALPDAPSSNDDDDEDISRLHFTVSDLYTQRDQLHAMRFSDDVAVREHGEQVMQMIEQELQFDELLKTSGLDSLPPFPGELEKVLELIQQAKPFPLHITS